MAAFPCTSAEGIAVAFFDLPLDQLRAYKPDRGEPEDFDSFWASTLSETRARPLNLVLEPVDVGLALIETYDVTFNGWGGQPIKGWLSLPRQRDGQLPCVVEYIGYGGGRGLLVERLLWASAGFAHFVMDNRGQGSDGPPGDTFDVGADTVNPHYPGFMTMGIHDPRAHYYRRLFSDAVRALDAVRSIPVVDSSRVAAYGRSQGAGISLAVAGLNPSLPLLLCDVPFLCNFRRAATLVDTIPYVEIANYLKMHRDHVEQVFRTLSYFDGMNFAARAQARALFSAGLMDDVTPPSTVFAAYNHYAGPKDIRTYEFNVHEGGGPFQLLTQVALLHDAWDRAGVAATPA
jgi:cephalosporin-C deacetylase